MICESPQRLRPKLISFDVFGTLISVRESSYGAFERIHKRTCEPDTY
jgi:hypothetical protein